MCTLSWQNTADGYALWFNRDELHTRAAERPPQEFRDSAGATWLAATDPVSEGTWLLTNPHGVTVALLNDYSVAWVPPADGRRESRGRLPLLARAARDARGAVAAVRLAVLTHTPPFAVVAVDAAGGTARLHWDGVSARITVGDRVQPPFSSSSFDPVRVIAARRRAFPRRGGPAALAAYHHSHDTAAGAESVNMSRHDASTRSIMHVRVAAEWVVLDYEPQRWPGAPLGASGHRQLRLPRQVADIFV